MEDIDDRFIDVKFDEQPQFVRGDLGRNPKQKMCAASDTAIPLLPENRWQELAEQLVDAGGLDRYVKWICNQGQEGSCVANASAQQHQVMQAQQFGVANVTRLSPISLYKRIGKSAQSGSMVDDALDEVEARGFVPLDTPENRKRFGECVMPATGFDERMPSGWETVARNFRGSQHLIVQSTEALFSCLLSGHPLVVGREGHSILYLRPVWSKGRWLIKYVNSWSEDWGEGFGRFRGGFGYDTRQQFEASAQWAFALRTLIVPPWLDV